MRHGRVLGRKVGSRRLTALAAFGVPLSSVESWQVAVTGQGRQEWPEERVGALAQPPFQDEARYDFESVFLATEMERRLQGWWSLVHKVFVDQGASQLLRMAALHFFGLESSLGFTTCFLPFFVLGLGWGGAC